jgi:hypothetical protein
MGNGAAHRRQWRCQEFCVNSFRIGAVFFTCFFPCCRRRSGWWESGNPWFGFPLFHRPQLGSAVFSLGSVPLRAKAVEGCKHTCGRDLEECTARPLKPAISAATLRRTVKVTVASLHHRTFRIPTVRAVRLRAEAVYPLHLALWCHLKDRTVREDPSPAILSRPVEITVRAVNYRGRREGAVGAIRLRAKL